MPEPVSKKQYRLMQAIAHEGNKSISTARPDHGPNPSVAKLYTKGKVDYKSLPESKGKEHEGGNWDHHRTKKKHHKKESKKNAKEKSHIDKKHEKVNKSDDGQEYLDKALPIGAAAMLILDNNSNILLGRHRKGGLAFPGGDCSSHDLDSKNTAIRETYEETGLIVDSASKIWSESNKNKTCDVYLANSFTGKLTPSQELDHLNWYEPNKIPWDKVRDCCVKPLEHFINNKLGKSEELNKNIIRDRSTTVYEVTHGDALKLVGTGLFRKLKSSVGNMQDEDFKDVQFDTYKLKIRKHMNDVYSGNVVDGHKVIYQFTNKSLPEITVALMSVFEWYHPEDEDMLNSISDEEISDEKIKEGLGSLINNYKKHNIGNIYEEMENIRKQIRNDAAVDVQQVENRIMKLFDKLEETMHLVADKHNKLKDLTEKELEDIDKKLRELQQKIETISQKPETIQAVSSNVKNPDKVHQDEYPYLPKPQIEISPDGRIKITFGSEWTRLEKENFLHDMKAKIVKKEK